MNKKLHQLLALADDPTLNDGAYWAHLEDVVVEFNNQHGTDFDPYNTVLEYLTNEDV